MVVGRSLEDVKPDGSFGKFDAEIPELLAEVGMAMADTMVSLKSDQWHI